VGRSEQKSKTRIDLATGRRMGEWRTRKLCDASKSWGACKRPKILRKSGRIAGMCEGGKRGKKPQYSDTGKGRGVVKGKGKLTIQSRDSAPKKTV